ncbi:Hypothetical predicted protein [Paramuricea clavata]|nr:Hypothetical predicted protein [Paramuricea clavata]
MDFPDWINTSILKFIAENADEQVGNRKDILAKPTLYWVVVNDRDFEPGNKLKLKSIGQTQVYVGKANNGIQGRWITDGKSHCEMIKKCLDNVCAMTTYDPLRLEGIQLVDARLALAKVRGERTALFVIKTFGDAVEKAEIALQKAQVRLNKAQRDVDSATAPSRTQTAYPCITPGPVTMPYQYNPPRPVTMSYQYNPTGPITMPPQYNPAGPITMPPQYNPAGPITMPPQYNPAGPITMPPQYNPAGPITMPPQYNPAGSCTMPHQYIPPGPFTMAPQYNPPVYPIMPQTSPLNTTSSRESSRLQELEAEVEKRQEELDEATAVDNDPKTIRKAKAETQLTQAEKQHRKGKRVHEPWKNIIPYKDYQISWKPTDMGYGMNCH